MKRTLSTLVLIAASTMFANAQAGELYPLPVQDYLGAAKTRAQVQEELRTAIAAHQITNGEQSFSGAVTDLANARSRAEVMAEGAKTQGLDMAFYLRG
jgi:hypothetical protein